MTKIVRTLTSLSKTQKKHFIGDNSMETTLIVADSKENNLFYWISRVITFVDEITKNIDFIWQQYSRKSILLNRKTNKKCPAVEIQRNWILQKWKLSKVTLLMATPGEPSSCKCKVLKKDSLKKHPCKLTKLMTNNFNYGKARWNNFIGDSP